MPSVSVIVPIYNTEKYLPRCLESLVSQTLEDIEIICVDDGSTDSSPSILDDFASRFPKIRAVHTENGGVSGARNIDLAMTNGDYIGFLDSDDSASPGMFQTLLSYALDTDSSIVQCSYDKASRRVDALETFCGKDEIVTALMDFDITNAVWDKLYRRDVIEEIRFPSDLKFAEDFEFNAHALVKAKNATLIPDSLIHYTERDESESHHSINNGHIKGFRVYDYLRLECADSESVPERELSESLRFLESAAGHSEIDSRSIDDLFERIRRNSKYITHNRYLSSSGRMRARFASSFPVLYLSILKFCKKVRGGI